MVGGGAGGGWGVIDRSQLQVRGTTAVQGSEHSIDVLHAYYCLAMTVQILYIELHLSSFYLFSVGAPKFYFLFFFRVVC